MRIFNILILSLLIFAAGCGPEYIKITAQEENGKLVLTLEKEMRYTDVEVYKFTKEKRYFNLIYSFGTKELRELKDYPSAKVFVLGELPEGMIEYNAKESVKLEDLQYNCLYTIYISGFGKKGFGNFVVVNDNGHRKIINLTYEEAKKFTETGIINDVNYW